MLTSKIYYFGRISGTPDRCDLTERNWQGGLLTVIPASRMTGNPQISGEISGQNHVFFMSRMGSGQNNA